MDIYIYFRSENNPPAQNVEAFWQVGEGWATVKEGDPQTQHHMCG